MMMRYQNQAVVIIENEKWPMLILMSGTCAQVEDLRIVMRYLEHWAHRLFPMMPFVEVLERIERLGTKRDVQVGGSLLLEV